MKAYEVSVVKTQCANIKVEAESPEAAEAKVRKMFEDDGLRGWVWIDYGTSELDLNGFKVTWVEPI
jgi:hypothetical protein